jgi:hypothetical protein
MPTRQSLIEQLPADFGIPADDTELPLPFLRLLADMHGSRPPERIRVFSGSIINGLLQTADVVHHTQDIIHRDISPPSLREKVIRIRLARQQLPHPPVEHFVTQAAIRAVPLHLRGAQMRRLATAGTPDLTVRYVPPEVQPPQTVFLNTATTLLRRNGDASAFRELNEVETDVDGVATHIKDGTTDYWGTGTYEARYVDQLLEEVNLCALPAEQSAEFFAAQAAQWGGA